MNPTVTVLNPPADGIFCPGQDYFLLGECPEGTPLYVQHNVISAPTGVNTALVNYSQQYNYQTRVRVPFPGDYQFGFDCCIEDPGA